MVYNADLSMRRSGTGDASVVRVGAHTDIRDKLARWTVSATLFYAVYRETFGQDSLFHIGSFHLTLVEPVLIISLVAIFSCFGRSLPRPNIPSLAVLALGLLLFINLVRGVNVDLVPALNSLRISGLLITVLILGVLHSNSTWFISYCRRAITISAAALLLVVLARLIFGPSTFMLDARVAMAAQLGEARAITAQGAFIMAAALTIQLSDWVRCGRNISSVKLYAFLLFLVCLMLTRQGTATICGLVGVSIVILLENRRNRGVRILFASIPIVFIASILWLQPKSDFSQSPTSAPLWISSMLDNRQATLETRKQVWRGVIKSYSFLPDIDKVIGTTAGSRPVVLIESRRWGHVAWAHTYHSMYYATLVSYGALGLTFLIVLFISSVAVGIGFLKRGAGGSLSGALGIALIVISAVISYSYDIRSEAAVIILASGALVRLDRRDRDRSGEGRQVGRSMRRAPTPMPSATDLQAIGRERLP